MGVGTHCGYSSSRLTLVGKCEANTYNIASNVDMVSAISNRVIILRNDDTKEACNARIFHPSWNKTFSYLPCQHIQI